MVFTFMYTIGRVGYEILVQPLQMYFSLALLANISFTPSILATNLETQQETCHDQFVAQFAIIIIMFK